MSSQDASLIMLISDVSSEDAPLITLISDASSQYASLITISENKKNYNDPIYIYTHTHMRHVPPFQQSILYKLFRYKLYYKMCYQLWAIVYKVQPMSLMSSKTRKNT
jgi:hypothetical protein